MADQWSVISVLVAGEFVVMTALLLILVPLEVAAPLLPLALLLAVALALSVT